jgi:hypothetical protein
MRKEVYIKRKVIKLRCRKCGKKATYYGNNLPSDYWEGWHLYKTEICPDCIDEYATKRNKIGMNVFVFNKK